MESLEGEGNNNNNKVGDEERLLEAGATTFGGGAAALPPHHNHNHHHILSRDVLKIVLLFTAVALSCVVLYHSAYPLQFFPKSFQPPHSSSFSLPDESTHGNNTKNTTSSSNYGSVAPGNSSEKSVNNNVTLPSTNKKQIKLEDVLEKAAMRDKTVIITTLNAAWTAPNSIFELFLESFRIGNQTQDLLKHVLVVALDKTAYARCSELHPHCYALTTEGVDFSGEAHFMSDDYLKMMWRRIDFLRIVLETGYNFIFTDADILWFRQPFAHFYPDADFQIACDHYWYDSSDLDNSPNGGFNYVKSNERTIKFYKFWYDAREAHPGKHDQDVLNMIKYNPFLKDIGLKIKFLDTAFFGGFCEPSKDLNFVCTMHANCCIGLGNKMHDLTMALDDWKKFIALPSSERLSKPQTWTVPRICG